MRNDIIELVKALTATDPKSLTAKGLKMAEECGDVAKSILPYENAAGTLHRVVHKGKILEDSVDVILVALSIAYSLGFTDEDINGAMQKKALYWSQLQENELKFDPDKIPFEIHITVEVVDDIERFRVVCKEIGVKPILLDLHTKANGAVKDLMTSQVIVGSTTKAFSAMGWTALRLEEFGYKVTRQKIEAAPWHPASPKADNSLKHESDNYFESHIEVTVDNGDPNRSFERLKAFLEGSELHLSSNFFKKMDDGVGTVMVTLRNNTQTLETFKSILSFWREKLINGGFILNAKDVIEYAIHDSNVLHDSEWMRG